MHAWGPPRCVLAGSAGASRAGGGAPARRMHTTHPPPARGSPPPLPCLARPLCAGLSRAHPQVRGRVRNHHGPHPTLHQAHRHGHGCAPGGGQGLPAACCPCLGAGRQGWAAGRRESWVGCRGHLTHLTLPPPPTPARARLHGCQPHLRLPARQDGLLPHAGAGWVVVVVRCKALASTAVCCHCPCLPLLPVGSRPRAACVPPCRCAARAWGGPARSG